MRFGEVFEEGEGFFRRSTREQEFTEEVQKGAGENREILAVFGEGTDETKCFGQVSVGEAGGERDEVLGFRRAEHDGDGRFVDGAIGQTRYLGQERFGIAHPALGDFGDHANGSGGDLDLFRFGDAGEFLGDAFDRESGKVETLATGKDGGWYLVDLSGRKDEDDMCRWFLESLEERIESAGREHMDFVDDVDLV
mgnify:CR=1 FL=1